MMTFLKWIESTLLKPYQYFALALASGFLLFGSHIIGLDPFVANNRVWIGIVFIFSIATLFALGLRWLASFIKSQNAYLRSTQRLRDLTPKEQAILKPYFDYNTHTQVLNIGDGSIVELINEKIIYRAGLPNPRSGETVCNIQPWAWDYLRKHPEFLRTK